MISSRAFTYRFLRLMTSVICPLQITLQPSCEVDSIHSFSTNERDRLESILLANRLLLFDFVDGSEERWLRFTSEPIPIDTKGNKYLKPTLL